MAAKRRTKARKELIEELMLDFKVILAYVGGDEDDLVVSMTEAELTEAQDLLASIVQVVNDETENRKKPKTDHAGGRSSKGMAGRGGKSIKMEV